MTRRSATYRVEVRGKTAWLKVGEFHGLELATAYCHLLRDELGLPVKVTGIGVNGDEIVFLAGETSCG